MLETAIYEVAYVPLEAIFIGIASAIGYDLSRKYTTEQMYKDVLEYDPSAGAIIRQAPFYYGNANIDTSDSDADSTTVTYVAPVYVDKTSGGNGGNGNKNTRIDKWLSAAVTSILIDKIKNTHIDPPIWDGSQSSFGNMSVPLGALSDNFDKYITEPIKIKYIGNGWTTTDIDNFPASAKAFQPYIQQAIDSGLFSYDQTNYCVHIKLKDYSASTDTYKFDVYIFFNPEVASTSSSNVTITYDRYINVWGSFSDDGFITNVKSSFGVPHVVPSRFTNYHKVIDGTVTSADFLVDYSGTGGYIFGNAVGGDVLVSPNANSDQINLDLDIDDPNQPAVIDEWQETRSAIQVIKDDVPQLIDSISLGFGSTLPVLSDLVSGQIDVYEALSTLSQTVSTTGQTFIDSITPWISIADTITSVTSDFLSEGIFGNIWHYVIAFFGTAHSALTNVRYIIFEKNPTLTLLFFAPMAIATVFGILHKLL